MKSTRLVSLVALMTGLIALRLSRGFEDDELAQPVARARPTVATPPLLSAAGQSQASQVKAPDVAETIAETADLAAGTRELDAIEPSNAFASRMQPSSPPPNSPPSPPAPKPVAIAVAAPASAQQGMPDPVPPPLTVIGTWQDEAGLSVFLASPQGVRQGRVGDVLLVEYRIVSVTTQQVKLIHLPTNKETMLPVSGAR